MLRPGLLRRVVARVLRTVADGVWSAFRGAARRLDPPPALPPSAPPGPSQAEIARQWAAVLAEQRAARAACIDLDAVRRERAQRRVDDDRVIVTTAGELRRQINEAHRAELERAIYAERRRFIRLAPSPSEGTE